jgi:hypothetical protein
VAELVIRARLKIVSRKGCGFDSHLRHKMEDLYSKNLAYVIGIALGDGNLSNPNGRAVRLRITCDSKYPLIGEKMQQALSILFPNNKVSIRYRNPSTCFDISVYSNKLNDLLPWTCGKGTKLEQNAHVPNWILENLSYSRECLKGLLETDGCIYIDRGYRMVNFTNYSSLLAKNVQAMIASLGFRSALYTTKLNEIKYKYSIRITKDAENLIKFLDLKKI